MPKVYQLGRFAGLNVSARPSLIPAFFVLWIGLSAIGIWLLDLPPTSALAGGLAAAVLHYLSEFWHQIGHATAARMTRHPMSGVLFWGFLSTSRYPAGEGDLPAGIHIRRALGGPVGSLALALAAGVLALALRQNGGVPGWLALFLFIDNLFVFTLGALLPLGFNDGSTLLHWLGRR